MKKYRRNKLGAVAVGFFVLAVMLPVVSGTGNTSP